MVLYKRPKASEIHLSALTIVLLALTGTRPVIADGETANAASETEPAPEAQLDVNGTTAAPISNTNVTGMGKNAVLNGAFSRTAMCSPKVMTKKDTVTFRITAENANATFKTDTGNAPYFMYMGKTCTVDGSMCDPKDKPCFCKMEKMQFVVTLRLPLNLTMTNMTITAIWQGVGIPEKLTTSVNIGKVLDKCPPKGSAVMIFASLWLIMLGSGITHYL